jgi:hypothetical protein
MQQSVFDRGTEVGELARQLYPGGVNASPDLPRSYEKAIEYTSSLIASDTPVIYEAGFSHNGVHCFMDILVREEGGWHAYEVKSSTNVSNIYHLDAALQYWVMHQSGLPLTGIDIVVLNSSFVRFGQIDIQRLFKKQTVLQQVLRLQPLVAQKVVELQQMLTMPAVPAVGIGPHCTDPYTCDFTGHCWQHIPDHSVFEVTGLIGPKKWELYNKGILRMEDIPEDYPLTPIQKLQIAGLRRGVSRWNKAEVKKFIDSLEYPMYFLDFESFQPAVPLFDQSRPYQQVPFQYSLDMISAPGEEPVHMEFLAEAGPDPRPLLAEQMINQLGDSGNILVYNQAFEKRILQDIGRDFPGYLTQLTPIVDRIRDLMDPFRKRQIYLPAMNGSYSIKAVLPALVPGYGYHGLNIADGVTASISFQGLFNITDPDRIESIRQDLLTYCGMDTRAMVKILERMRLQISDF